MHFVGFTLMSLISIIPRGVSECDTLYFNFCDDLNDLKNLKREDAKPVSDLVIGNIKSNNELHDLDKNQFDFSELVNLKSLVIVRQIKKAKKLEFASHKPWISKLRNLFLYGNSLNRLREGFFTDAKLNRLSLVKNNIEYINKKAFLRCEIESIDISNNNIDTIEKDVFSEKYLANFTKELILKHNQIEQIEPGSFPVSLEILDLSYNKLEEGHLNTTFENLVNLKELFLSHNKIYYAPNMSTLVKLEVLDMSFNKFFTFDKNAFTDLVKLQILDLSNNEIYFISGSDYFEAGTYAGAFLPVQVSLTFNRLTFLDVSTLRGFQRYVLFLSGNPWNCKCWNEMDQYLVDEHIARNECDLRFFNDGVTPYCIPLFENDNITKKCDENKLGIFLNSKYDQKDLQRFDNAVARTRDNVNCSLTPRRLYENRDYMVFDI